MSDEMKKNRPYKYNSKSRLTPNSQSFPFKVNSLKNDVKVNLENTLTKLRIVDDSSKEEETLDDSFLEGRSSKKERIKAENKEKKEKEKQEKKEKIRQEKEKSKKEKEEKKEKKEKKNDKPVKQNHSLGNSFISFATFCAIILVVLYVSHLIIQHAPSLYNKAKNRIIVTDKNSGNRLDDNYLFVGDFHTSKLSFNDYHYVKVSTNTLTTSDLLNNMKSMVYDYNPSIIFLEVGMMDIDSGTSTDEFIHNYGRIIDLIHTNRPNAKIYVESIYPINRDVDHYDEAKFNRKFTNDDIDIMNSALKTLASEKKVQYLDINSSVSRLGSLDTSYTSDGITLNDNGYQEVYKEINKVVG